MEKSFLVLLKDLKPVCLFLGHCLFCWQCSCVFVLFFDVESYLKAF